MIDNISDAILQRIFQDMQTLENHLGLRIKPIRRNGTVVALAAYQEGKLYCEVRSTKPKV